LPRAVHAHSCTYILLRGCERGELISLPATNLNC